VHVCALDVVVDSSLALIIVMCEQVRIYLCYDICWNCYRLFDSCEKVDHKNKKRNLKRVFVNKRSCLQNYSDQLNRTWHSSSQRSTETLIL